MVYFRIKGSTFAYEINVFCSEWPKKVYSTSVLMQLGQCIMNDATPSDVDQYCRREEWTETSPGTGTRTRTSSIKGGIYLPKVNWVPPVDQSTCSLTKLVDLGGFFFRHDLWLQRERGGSGQLTLLFVFPGLQGALKCLQTQQANSKLLVKLL